MKKQTTTAGVILVISFLCFGCRTDRATMLSPGSIITSGDMVSPNEVGENTKTPEFRRQIENSLNQSLKLYEIKVANKGETNSLRVFATKVPVKITVEDDQSMDIYGKNYFAAQGDVNAAYAALNLGVKYSFEYLQEIQLSQNDPQFRVTYHVDPTELLKYQLVQPSNTSSIFLFQRYIAAPSVVLKHKLARVESNVNFPVIFQGSSATISKEFTTLNRRLVFRRYANGTAVDELTQGNMNMFTVTEGDYGLTNGKTNVPPDFVKIKFNDKTYRFTPEYVSHLKDESVVFDCPTSTYSEITTPKDLGKPVTKKPIPVKSKKK